MNGNSDFKKKILIVDDSMVARKFISMMVSELNVVVDFAESGNIAIEKIRKTKFDIILLDLLMDDGNGFDVLNFLNESNNNTPVIVISADIQETTKIKCTQLGAIAIINKPPSKGNLISLVKNLIFQNGDK